MNDQHQDDLFQVKLNQTGMHAINRMLSIGKTLFVLSITTAGFHLILAITQIYLFFEGGYWRMLPLEQKIYPFVSVLIVGFMVLQILFFWEAIKGFHRSLRDRNEERFNQSFRDINTSITYAVMSISVNIIITGYQIIIMLKLLRSIPHLN